MKFLKTRQQKFLYLIPLGLLLVAGFIGFGILKGTLVHVEATTISYPITSTPDVSAVWNLNETADDSCTGGADVCDANGTYNGNIVGTATIVDTQSSKGRYFNGTTGNYINFGDNANFEKQSFVIEATVKKEGSCGAYGVCSILSKGSSGFEGFVFFIYNNKLKFTINDQGSDGLQYAIGNTTLSDNTWYTVAVAVDNANKTIKLYLNGTLDGTGTYTQTINYGNANLEIGNANGGEDLPFNGIVDSVKYSGYSPAVNVATVSSSTYTIGVSTITGVPVGTSKATFLAALSKGDSNQTWDDSNISDPVVTGDTLVVTAQDGTTVVTYTITTYIPYSGTGDGTQDSPYEITSCSELQEMSNLLSFYFVLSNDIDCSGSSAWNSGQGFVPVGPHPGYPFTGTLDGKGYTINGLTINKPANGGYTFIGLFGDIEGGTVENLNLSNTSITAESAGDVGSLAGALDMTRSNGTGTIRDVTVTNSNIDATGTSSMNAGGLVGYSSGTITNTSVRGGQIQGDIIVGGLVGNLNGGTISSSATAITVSGHQEMGGIAGLNQGGTISKCFATGTVSGTSEVGGIVGVSNSSTGTTILNSYATGYISGGDNVGGFAGVNLGTITNSYSIGLVTGTGSGVGGFIGYGGGTVTSSYYDSDTSNMSDTGNGTPETTSDMKLKLTYSGWNFSTIWNINSNKNNGYPFFGFFDNGNGNGTLSSPYEITNCNSLQGIQYDLTASYVLVSDIDCSETSTWNSGAGFIPIGTGPGGSAFVGTLNGNGYTISNVVINKPSNSGGAFVGIFGAADDGSLIENLNIANINITADNYSYVGGVVGGLGIAYTSKPGGINNVHVLSGNIIGNQYVGGLVGQSFYGVKDSSSEANINAVGNYVGGLVGLIGPNSIADNIENSFATGSVNGVSNVGGLIGESNGKILNSYATGSVTGTSSVVGGLVGDTYNDVTNSYASGNVSSGGGYTGGLIGQSYGNIADTYATGDVTGVEYNIGGLVGEIHAKDGISINIERSFATGNVFGNDEVGGLAGETAPDGTGTILIKNTYSTGNVAENGTTQDGCDIGGFIGYLSIHSSVENSYSIGIVSSGDPSFYSGGFIPDIDGGPVTNSFWDMETSGYTTSAGGTGKTTAEMKTLATYTDAGWDFTSIWNIYPSVNNGYPFFGSVTYQGSGTELAPYQITTCKQLQDMQYSLSSNYILMNDIDCSETSTWNNGVGFISVGSGTSNLFKGSLDGNNKKISNLVINKPTSSSGAFIGIFGAIDGAQIKNLTIENINITAQQYYSVGALVGSMGMGSSGNSVIDNVHASGSIYSANGAGGLVGCSYGKEDVIKNSSVDVDITSSNNAGGLLGWGEATIQNSSALGDVLGVGYVGGLVGQTLNNSNYSNSISGSFASGNVTGTDSVGGLVGLNMIAISNSYAQGNVSFTGSSGLNAGGLIGKDVGNTTGYTIENCHATGNVSGNAPLGSNSTLGGLIGWTDMPVTNCYAEGDITGSAYDIGGLIGMTSAQNTTIANSHFKGSITATNTAAVGGIFGWGTVNIVDSYSEVNINSSGNQNNSGGQYTTGGLAGITFNDVTNSYSTGNIVSDSALVGGIAGVAYSESPNSTGVTNCHSSVHVTGSSNSNIGTAGLAGRSFGDITSSYATGNVDFTGINAGVAGSGVAGLIGASYGVVSGSYAEGNVNSSDGNTGGLIGYNTGYTVDQSYATGDIVANGDSVGGLIGTSSGHEISGSYATGNVSSSGNNIGGLIGYNSGYAIDESYATGDISGNNYIGGLLGLSLDCDVTNTYAIGKASGSEGVGGLIGAFVGTLTNSYSKGLVTGTVAGGLVGEKYAGSPDADFIFSSTYYNSDTSGQSDTGKGIPITTTQMSTKSSFTNWNFDTIWTLGLSVNASVSPINAGTILTKGQFLNSPVFKSQTSDITVTAIAASGFKFVNWTENGSVVSTDKVYTFNSLSTVGTGGKECFIGRDFSTAHLPPCQEDEAGYKDANGVQMCAKITSMICTESGSDTGVRNLVANFTYVPIIVAPVTNPVVIIDGDSTKEIVPNQTSDTPVGDTTDDNSPTETGKNDTSTNTSSDNTKESVGTKLWDAFAVLATSTYTISKEMVKTVKELPISDQASQNITAATLAIVAATPAVSIGLGSSYAIAYILRFFSMLLAFFGIGRKKRNCGLVYDSVTKEPLRNAIVRIFDLNGELVATEVTNMYGIFETNIDSGQYRIEVQASNYRFPSMLIFGIQDLPYNNIYKGESFNYDSSSTVSYSIPVDPLDESMAEYAETITKNRLINFTTFLFSIFVLVGLVFSVISYIKVPTTLNLIFLLMYIFLIILGIIVRGQGKYKFGTVTNDFGNCLEGVQLGLTETDFNTIYAKRVTNKQGKYRFIVPGGNYKLISLDSRYDFEEQKEYVFNSNNKKLMVVSKNIKVTAKI